MFKSISRVLFSLIGFLFIVSLSVTIIVSFRPVYYHDISALSIAEETGITDEVIRRNYDVLIDYNQFWTGEKELIFPDFPMSESGEIHFKEVRTIFIILQFTGIISGILFLPSLFIVVRKRLYSYFQSLALTTVMIPTILGILILINWDRFFELLHKILFRNDFWLFDPVTDPIINILPDAFFLHCAVGIIGLVFSGGIMSFLFGMILKRKV